MIYGLNSSLLLDIDLVIDKIISQARGKETLLCSSLRLAVTTSTWGLAAPWPQAAEGPREMITDTLHPIKSEIKLTTQKEKPCHLFSSTMCRIVLSQPELCHINRRKPDS